MGRQTSAQRWCSLVLLAVLISLSLWYVTWNLAPAVAFRIGAAMQAGRHAAMVDQVIADQELSRQEQEDTARRLSDRVRSAVVRIEALPAKHLIQAVHASPDVATESAWSCGLIIDPAGRILTNYDSVVGAREFRIHLPEGAGTHVARLVGGDVETNLAVLRIDPPLESLPAADLCEGRLPGVGDHVIVVGHAYRPNQTLWIGTVSCGGRQSTASCCCPQDFIQTAAANPFNHGAPMINQRGEVVGIASTWGDGMGGTQGLAVPSGVARQVVEQLLEYGQVRRGWLGAFLHPVRAIPQPECPAGAIGIAFDYIVPDSPADKAGISHGDLLLQVGGRAIQSLSDLRRRIAASPKTELSLSLLRDGATFERQVQVELRPGPAQASLPGEMELQIRLLCFLSSDERRRLGIQVDDGVVVQVAHPAGPAGKLRPADVIMAVNNVPTPSLADFCRELREWREAEPRPAISLTVRNGDQTRTVEIVADNAR